MPGEERLAGGNVSGGVVRVGDTVRRPAGFWSASVDGLLRHLEGVGYRGAPRSLGFDDLGRHVLEYVAGDVVMPFAPTDHDGACRRVGGLLREFHDAASGFVPPADARWNVVIPPDREELVIHHDAAPWNLVCDPARWVLIDWDGAGPGSRLWDIAYAAHGFVALTAATPPNDASRRLAALAAGYGLDEQERRDLVGLLHRRILSMYELLRQGDRSGVEPWNRLWSQGHGAVWLANADYVEQHIAVFRAALLDAD